jgi:hypothetical protein
LRGERAELGFGEHASTPRRAFLRSVQEARTPARATASASGASGTTPPRVRATRCRGGRSGGGRGRSSVEGGDEGRRSDDYSIAAALSPRGRAGRNPAVRAQQPSR